MSVEAIDKKTVHQICSGQVVLSLAVAVKELVENSLDAGATTIEVRLREHGSEMLEVVDNGSGVEEANFQGLTLKYHTSKIQDFSDLEMGVTTFGFRGEALSSLCALSDMTIMTRHKSAAVGTKLEYDNRGLIRSKSSCARGVGTTVTLSRLFHTLPVRHKEFNRNVKREFSKMVQMLQGYCLVSTGVRIACFNQSGKGKKMCVLSTSNNQDLRSNVVDIFGTKQLEQLVEFRLCSEEDLKACEEGSNMSSMDLQLFQFSGYISRCNHGYGRSSADRQFYFFNSRPCDYSKLSRVVNEVYHTYNRHQYPCVVLNITTARDSVDVNVTPDKRQVMLHHEKTLLLLIRISLTSLFEPMQGKYDDGTATTNSRLPTAAVMTPSSPDTPTLSKFSSIKRQLEMGSGNEKPLPKQARLSEFAVANQALPQRSLSDSVSMEESPLIESKAQGGSLSNSVSVEGAPLIQSRIHEGEEALAVQAEGGSCGCPGDADLLEEERMMEEMAAEKECSSMATQDSAYGGLTGSIKSDVCSRLETSEASVLSKTHRSPVLSETEGVEILQSEGSVLSATVSSGHVESFSPRKNTLQDFSYKSPHVMSSPVKAERLKHSPNRVVDERDVSSSPTKGSVVVSKPSGSSQSTAELVPCHSSSSQVHASKKCQKGHIEYPVTADTVVQFDIEAVTARLRHLALKHTGNKIGVGGASSASHSQGGAEMDGGEEEGGGGRVRSRFRAKIEPSSNKAAEEELRKEIKKSDFLKMEILGQFNLGFIVTKLGSNLFIVDQHASDEKYNFERLQRETVIQHQNLLVPKALELTAISENIVMDNLKVFELNGFKFSIDPEAPPMQRVKLSAKPVSKNWSMEKKDIEEMVFMLSDDGCTPGEVVRPTAVRAMFASRACRGSIMIGTALSKSDMRKLLDHMSEMDQPWNCPHGRPTMRHLLDLDRLQPVDASTLSEDSTEPTTS